MRKGVKYPKSIKGKFQWITSVLHLWTFKSPTGRRVISHIGNVA